MESASLHSVLKRITLNAVSIPYSLLEKRRKRTAGKGNKISFTQKKALMLPYIHTNFLEQLKVIAPIGLYLILFQMIILRQDVSGFWGIVFGLFAVCVGLMLFMDGLKFGLMPFAESIGNTLPNKTPFFVMMLIVFFVGVATTFSEPAIGALEAVGSVVKPEAAPYLFALLNFHTMGLMLVVGFGVGVAAVIGVLRFVYGWSLKPLIYIVLIPSMLLTLYALTSPVLQNVYSLAWDCGAVTTGPVTVPIVLALGVGISAAVGKSNSSLSGFGIVTLASLIPVISVVAFCMIVFSHTSAEQILQQVSQIKSASAASWFHLSPYSEVVMGARAVVPLVILLFIVFYIILQNRFKEKITLSYGLAVALLGIMIFNIGLTYGLSYLGSQTGQMSPAAYTGIKAVLASPVYGFVVGIIVVALFIFFMGFGATLAEPALNALGVTVESLTNGVMPKTSLIYSVASGVGVGLMLGIMKIIFHIPLAYMVLPGYVLAILLTVVSSEEVVNVAWDSAGVTTGPITVPLVLACGLGFSLSSGAIDGFGVLAMASVCPILAVLMSGLLSNYRAKKKMKQQ